ncbi:MULTISPECIES: peptide deformylase [unclassified Minwuia]|jgi:peptide deformylase|uniref:peptide deformylase n=1 Tax=unclassified Minwuia TaxID=2618799 RepID=UPI002479B2DA|nr:MULTISPECIES: peptide deformylase [unclassified Minwuia]
MALLPIITAPDPRLKVRSEAVGQIDDELRAFMDDMLETMYDAPGVGLSAIQVGVPKRVMVVDCADDGAAANPIYLINPEILESSEDLRAYEEGCLSLPEQYAEVERPATIRVKYLDQHGATQELTADGLLATCIQHEMDHFEGILFVDHISALKRNMILRRLKKAKKLQATG